MGTDRLKRVNELLKREVATALYRTMNEQGFDFSAVTVTHVITSTNLRHARVLVSIRDHANDRMKMLNIIRRHRNDIQKIVHHHVVLKYTPKLTFELDESIAEGDHILDLIAELEKDMPDQDIDENIQ